MGEFVRFLPVVLGDVSANVHRAVGDNSRSQVTLSLLLAVDTLSNGCHVAEGELVGFSRWAVGRSLQWP